MQLLDGKKIRNDILLSLQSRVGALPFKPLFCDILVGTDPVQAQYVQMKEKMAEGIGIQVHQATLPLSATTEDIIARIREVSSVPHMAGIIVQLPLPSHVDTQQILDAIPPALDVDAMGSSAMQSFYEGEPLYVPPTALAVMALIDASRVSHHNREIVVVGQGALVGKPVAHLLRMRGCVVSVVTSKTKGGDEIIKQADIVISATGVPGRITKDILKEGVLVIDAGTAEDAGSIVGDVATDGLETLKGILSPVPGGVGPVTVAMLLHNVVTSAEKMAYV